MKPRAEWDARPTASGFAVYDGLVVRGALVVWRCEHNHAYRHEALTCAETQLERGEADLHRPGGGKGKAVVPVDAQADIP